MSAPGLPTADEVAAALATTGYRYSDPIDDAQFPRIAEAGDEPPDQFPPGWGAEPTERDQAAITAGNA